MNNKTYFKFEDGKMLTMCGRSRKATSLGFHNSPGRARQAVVETKIDNLLGMHRDEVRALAKGREIVGRSKLNKTELAEAIANDMRREAGVV